MKLYTIQIRDRVTGQTKHESDFFDIFKNAVDYARHEYGSTDFSSKSYWILQEYEVFKNRCPYYVNANPCLGDVWLKEGILTCSKCKRDIPMIVEM